MSSAVEKLISETMEARRCTRNEASNWLWANEPEKYTAAFDAQAAAHQAQLQDIARNRA